jgi:antitoxin (DNA-binding transcriptional repressor) of toxin-antitoxin stability system
MTRGMTMVPIKKRISKSKLKARMLEEFRELETHGGELIVTDRERPVLRIVPMQETKSMEDLFGKYWGRVVIPDDIDEPTIDEWEET